MIIMNNSFWYDLKLKFLKSGNPGMLYIAINVIVFVIVGLMSLNASINEFVSYYLKFHAASSFWLSHFYTVVTYQFLHANIFHIFFNMLVLYWVGQLLLDFIKPRQFHTIYLIGGVFGALFFAIIYNAIPYYRPFVPGSTLEGASAAVMAVFAALATLVPNYRLRLLIFGEVKIKYLLMVYIALDLLGSISKNSGGSISHLGGAIFGFAYIKLLQNGTDLSAIFQKKAKLKVVKNQQPKQTVSQVNQREVDAILDKISQSGYDNLTKDEKETLFKASKN